MAKIKAVFSKNCNYIYHMMSVSKCGYDNDYGNKYKAYHAESDLQILKKHENLITIKGGEYIGELYGFCVVSPAVINDNNLLPDYFEAIIDMLENNDLEMNLKKYHATYEAVFLSYGVVINAESQKQFYDSIPEKKQEIIDIFKVLLNNYSIYSDTIWEISKAELTTAADELNVRLSKNDYSSKWEKTLNHKNNYDDFYAIICNSLQHGVQCIDVSYNKHIFNIPEDYSSAVKLINHEFGIYLLKDILSETSAFEQVNHKILESLAEYFNIIVTGGHTDWNWFNEYQDFYKDLRNKNPQITIKDMFLKAFEIK